MNQDSGFGFVYGLGAGIFFLAILHVRGALQYDPGSVGAREWIARIMFTWGVISGA